MKQLKLDLEYPKQPTEGECLEKIKTLDTERFFFESNQYFDSLFLSKKSLAKYNSDQVEFFSNVLKKLSSKTSASAQIFLPIYTNRYTERGVGHDFFTLLFPVKYLEQNISNHFLYNGILRKDIFVPAAHSSGDRVDFPTVASPLFDKHHLDSRHFVLMFESLKISVDAGSLSFTLFSTLLKYPGVDENLKLNDSYAEKIKIISHYVLDIKDNKYPIIDISKSYFKIQNGLNDSNIKYKIDKSFSDIQYIKKIFLDNFVQSFLNLFNKLFIFQKIPFIVRDYQKFSISLMKSSLTTYLKSKRKFFKTFSESFLINDKPYQEFGRKEDIDIKTLHNWNSKPTLVGLEPAWRNPSFVDYISLLDLYITNSVLYDSIAYKTSAFSDLFLQDKNSDIIYILDQYQSESIFKSTSLHKYLSNGINYVHPEINSYAVKKVLQLVQNETIYRLLESKVSNIGNAPFRRLSYDSTVFFKKFRLVKNAIPNINQFFNSLVSFYHYVYIYHSHELNKVDEWYNPDIVVKNCTTTNFFMRDWYAFQQTSHHLSHQKMRRFFIEIYDTNIDRSATPRNFLNDTSSMINRIEAYINDKKRTDLNLSMKTIVNWRDFQSIKSLHDALAKLDNDLRYPNILCDNSYYKNLESFDLTVPKTDHKIVFAPDTNTIRSWGTTQQHCIGSYSDSLNNKKKIVFGVKNIKDDTWFGHCILNVEDNKPGPGYTSFEVKISKTKSLYVREWQFYGYRNCALDAQVKKKINQFVIDLIFSEEKQNLKSKKTLTLTEILPEVEVLQPV